MRRLITLIITLTICWGISKNSKAQTLNAGDIAIIGYRTDAPDGFTFITLTDVPAGEVVHFTDRGWNTVASAWIANAEDIVIWTAPAGGVSCGTIINIAETAADAFTITPSTGAGTVMFAGDGGWSLAAGDQILAYRGGSGNFPATPVFITAINADYNAGDYNATTTWNVGNQVNNTSSGVPTGLTNGTDCLSLFPGVTEVDNAKYTGTLTGTSAAIRISIHDTTNWDDSDEPLVTEIFIEPSDYATPSVVCSAPCTDPDVPSGITATSNPICPSDSTTISWTGSLNGDATAWHIYTGGCGTTQLTTTTSNSIKVGPSGTTTYNIRGEGGCVTPGTCGSITINVGDAINPTPSCQNLTVYLDGTGNVTIVPGDVDNGSTDNCGIASMNLSASSFTCADLGANSTTLRVFDNTGNVDSCTATITVQDTTSPNASCQNITVFLDGTGNATIVPGDVDNGSSDNCGTPSLSLSKTAFTCADIGANNVTLTATDGSSNTGQCTATVTISDTVSPTAVCQNITVFLDGTGNATIVPGDVDNGSSDNCGTPSLSLSKTAFTCADIGANNVTLTATDGSSNTAQCVAVVTISDTTSPSIGTVANQTASVNASCGYNLADYTALLTNSDNCTASPTVTQSPAIGSAQTGTTTVTLTATDGNGNSSSTMFDVLPNDVTQPTPSCQNLTLYLDGTGNVTIVPGDVDNGSTDNCGIASMTLSNSSFTCANIGANSTTLRVFDAAGNVDSCTATITVQDTTSPTASCQNITVFLDGTGNATIVPGDVDNGSSDNCGTPSLSLSKTAFTCADIGANNVTLTATDGSSNTAQCMATVTIADTNSPSAVCQNITAYLDGTGNVSITAGDIDGGSTDNCTASLTLGLSQSAFNCTHLGANNVTLTVTDANSNSSQCTATVTISDTIAPTASCQNITLYLDGTGNVTIVPGDVDNGSTDNCGTPSLSLSQTAFTCANIGANNVTLTATDGSSNTAQCVATVTVLDTIAPTITCPGPQTAAVNASCGYTLADYTGMALNGDACTPSPAITQSPAIGSSQTGTTTVTLYATDASGNVDSCSFDVTPNDVTLPTPVCQNLTVYLDGTGNVTITAADVDNGSSDNCSVDSMALSMTSFTCANVGANSSVLRVFDGAGNVDSCTATITVQDTTSPTAVCQNITVYLDGTGSATITAGDVDGGSTDNCSIANLAIDKSSFTCADVGANTVTLTVTDASSNATQCTATVTVADTNSPTVTCQNITVYIDGSGNATITSADIDNGSSDNCGTPSLSISQSSFTSADLGANNITLIGTDGQGNQDSCVAVVTVSDTTSPNAISQNIDAFIDGAGNVSILASAVDNGSTDNGTIANIVVAPNSFNCANVGNNNIVLTVTDSEGNTDTSQAVVDIRDTIAPTITCPLNQTQVVDASCGYTLADYTGMATTSDNCTVSPTVTQTPAIGSTQSGTTTVTLYSTDASGNVDSCSFDVTPIDNVVPTITCPGNQTASRDSSCNFTIPDYIGSATSSDNCGTPTLVQKPAVGLVISSDTTIWIIATDGAGNQDSCSFTLTLEDNTPPVVTCPGDQSQTVDTNCSFVLNDYTAMASATDNCDTTITITQSPAAGTNVNGSTVVTIFAEDGSGNIDSCSFNVTALDSVAPTIVCPANISTCDPVVTYSDPTFSDNCQAELRVADSTNHVESGSTFTVGTTTLTFIVEDDAGNSATCSFDVTVNVTPTVDAGTSIDLLPGATTILDATSDGNYNYNWSPPDGLDDITVLNPTSNPGMDVIYTLTATSDSGCVSTDTVSVRRVASDLFITNVITPNNDGANDFWIVQNMPFTGCRVTIFNRWGTPVYESDNYANDWDGRLNGEVLPEGTYYYVIQCGDDPEVTGAITLISQE